MLDDNFATIVAAVEEGRGIHENTQKFIRFLFSTNLAEVFVVSVGVTLSGVLGLQDPAGGLLLPLTAAQILWINLVTDGLPALALSLDRNPGVMSQRPRPASAPLFDRRSLRFVLFGGLGKGLLALAILGLALTAALKHAGVHHDRRPLGTDDIGRAGDFAAGSANELDLHGVKSRRRGRERSRGKTNA